jgi:hypothetical protein
MWSAHPKHLRIAAFALASAFVLDPQAAPAQSPAAPVGPMFDEGVSPPSLDPYAFYVFSRDDPRPPEAPLSRQESYAGTGRTEMPGRSSGP